jgi:inositol phosphorylceramide mannosyltransferase catalytic subunit
MLGLPIECDVTRRISSKSSSGTAHDPLKTNKSRPVQFPTMHEQIPRRIIQTAKSSDLPLLQRAAQTSLKLLNPDFECLFFDDAAIRVFIDEKVPQYRVAFDSFRIPIQRIDFFRYLAVWELGGFYFDTDVLFASALQPLLSHRCIFPFEQLTLHRYLRMHYEMDWEIGNYAFGAVPKHPFLEAVIKNCVRAQNDPNWVKPMAEGLPYLIRSSQHVLYTTGPALLSRTLADSPFLADDVTVLFPADVCDERQWSQFGEYATHLRLNSWVYGGNFVLRRLADMSASRAMRRSLRDSLKVGKRRNAKGIRRAQNVATC